MILSPSTQKCVLLVFASVGCLSFMVQMNVFAEFVFTLRVDFTMTETSFVSQIAAFKKKIVHRVMQGDSVTGCKLFQILVSK